ncbi:hypothetical protein, partial [Sphingomonas elodea]|uniref:hypothetical protein n=1 Tax=Sphingomonas elodea TaxID=179878 RepID=UPI001ED9074F
AQRRFLSLFDIVGLDEGTCGRRLRVLQLLGAGCSVKAKPFHTCPYTFPYVGAVWLGFGLTGWFHKNVQERLLEMSCCMVAHSGGYVVEHQT